MNRNSTIQAYLIILISLSTIFYSCESSQKQNLPTQEEIADKARKDSIAEVLKDSLAAVEAERLAYLNRPWKTGTFVDEFGDPTSEKFIKTQVDGVFSNSATSNSYLFAEILIKKDAAGIFLHEYKKSRPAEKFIGGADIRLKNEDGSRLSINTSAEWNQQGGIKIDNNIGDYYHGEFDEFKKFIQNSTGRIKIVIQDDYSSSYLFEIDVTGFDEEFQNI